MQNNQARRASIILGGFMAVVLIAGTILPLLGNNTTTTDTVEPTTAPTATLPPPITDFTNITFDRSFLHPSGLFAVQQPPGWSASQPSQNDVQAQVNFINGDALSVIDVYVEKAGAAVTTEALDGRFTREVLDASWANFSNWRETNRRTEGDRLLIDFVVTLQGQDYVARQIVTTDGEWIYVTRVLAPNNATALITYLLENLPNGFTPFKVFNDTPFSWGSSYDPTFQHIIRYPAEWEVTDSAPGRLTNIASGNGVSLRVEGYANTAIPDAAAAESWVTSRRPNATILSTQPTERDGVSGFSVAYTFANADGEAQSGLAVLLNGANVLHTANLYFPAGDIDLNNIQPADTAAPTAIPTAEATGEIADIFGSLDDLAPAQLDINDAIFTDLALVMNTFRVLPALSLSPDSLPPATPTPLVLPTTIPAETTGEATADATSEPAATVEAISTLEVTAEATP